MSAHIQQSGLLSGRHMTLMAVIGLHALVIAALIAIRTVPTLIDPGAGPTIVELIPPDPPPPAPRPTLPNLQPTVTTPPVPTVVPVLIPIPVETSDVIPVQQGGTVPVDTGVRVGVSVGPVVPATTAPTRTATDLQYRITRSTDEYYPSASVTLEEEGVAVVRICVDATGKMQGVPTIETSSGHTRLDKAAVRWASESLRFTPATVDGVGVVACKGFRVKFDLH